MTAQEEFLAYKADFDKKLLKRARRQAIVLGLATVITVTAILYGTIQSIEAGTQRDQAIRNEQAAMEARLEVDKQRETHQGELESLKAKLEACKTTK
jgi:hypothetical protein